MREGRRSFLNWFLTTGAGAFLASLLYPVARYLIPPKVAESSAASVTLNVKPTEIKSNSGQIFKFGGEPGIVLRTPAGDLRAFSAVCTHLTCTVRYEGDTGTLFCPCHNGRFDLAGNVLSGPPPRPLETYAVEISGPDIIVARKS